MRACYIDNVAVFGTCQGIAARHRDLLVNALRSEGIATREEEGGGELTFLAFVLQSVTRWAPPAKRFWKPALATRWPANAAHLGPCRLLVHLVP